MSDRIEYLAAVFVIFGAGMYSSSEIYYDRMFYGFYDLFHFRLVNFVVEFRSAVYYGLRRNSFHDLVHSRTKAAR